MLPAAARLRRRPEFTATIRHGVRVGRARLVVHLSGRPDEHSVSDSIRVGFVVGRDVGPAVVRNRVRRRLRHLAADQLVGLTEAVPGHRIVVRARPAAAAASSRELAADLGAALDTAVRRVGRAAGRGNVPESTR